MFWRAPKVGIIICIFLWPKVQGKWKIILETEETEKWRRDEYLRQVILPRISCCQRFGVGRAWRVSIPTQFHSISFPPWEEENNLDGFARAWSTHIYVVKVWKTCIIVMFEWTFWKNSYIHLQGYCLLMIPCIYMFAQEEEMQEQQGCWWVEATIQQSSVPASAWGLLGLEALLTFKNVW